MVGSYAGQGACIKQKVVGDTLKTTRCQTGQQEPERFKRDQQPRGYSLELRPTPVLVLAQLKQSPARLPSSSMVYIQIRIKP